MTAPSYLIHIYEHRAYPLTGEHPFTIGRDAGCDIMVNEVSVSRHHAELRFEGGDYVVYSTGSTPTLLNDIPLTGPYSLREGDAFLVGTMKFVFTHERLPVAMAVAHPAPHPEVGVDDRRPTLTFPLQGRADPHRFGGSGIRERCCGSSCSSRWHVGRVLRISIAVITSA